jgi:3-oxoacyl-[acyl-carrier-protein] synthase-3
MLHARVDEQRGGAHGLILGPDFPLAATRMNDRNDPAVRANPTTASAPAGVADLAWRVQVVGLGTYLPRRRVASAELEAQAGLPEGWALAHSGVAFRHWAGPDEHASVMGAAAGLAACKAAGVAPSDLSLIVNASGSVERAIPDGGPLLQRALGLGTSGIASFTMHATCLSFIAGMEVAAERIAHARIRHALVVSSEIASVALDPGDAEVFTLFGDGAAAAVLQPTPEGEASEIHRVAWLTMGDDVELTTIRGGGSFRHPHSPLTVHEDALFQMQGPRVLKRAIRLLPALFERLGMDAALRARVRWIASHQASRAGLEHAARLGFDNAVILGTLEQMGNCIAASIPLTLEQGVRQGLVRRGDLGLLIGTGAGLSAAAMLMTY